VALLLRGAFATWQAHESDLTRVESGQATVRHLVRRIRQSQSVVSVSAPATTAGTLALLMPSGDTYVWARNSGTNQVLFGVGSATDLLAENISELSFECFGADGTTATTVVDEIQLIRCTAKVDLPGNAVGSRTITCNGWIRSW
ncbi:MAG: hypothetical protein KDA42_18215, partial [Planctomycetales bacterium]|nr:hypothetical protein [Planctomycetales bacterium]